MAKGTIAKSETVKKLQTAFGADWIGEYDKKWYVWANDGGSRVQIAISLTCPKVPVMIADSTPGGDLNFDDDASNVVVAAGAFQPADITDEERERVADLMAKLGI